MTRHEPLRPAPTTEGVAVDRAPVGPQEGLGEPVRGLYLLHLEPPYRHARHYLGYADDVARRVADHAAGGSRSSPLVRAALAAGSRVYLVRIWPGGDRTLERRLKRSGGSSRYCPACRASGDYHA